MYTSNPTTENELTAMINEDLYARTLANIARRAETLWADGYTRSKFAEGFYTVFSPKGAVYTVVLDAEIPCDCPAWSKYKSCKHYLAIDKIAQEEAQAAEFDRLMAEGETAAGCDPFARY